MTTETLTRLLATLALTGLACSADDTSGGDDSRCDGGKCDDDDELVASPCDGLMHDKAGRGLGSGPIAGGLGDPLAKIAFAGDSCPTTFTGVVDKLKKSDKCSDHKTVLVSEDSQLLDAPSSYRSVTSFECETEDGQSGAVWFSGFGIRAASDPEKTRIPDSVEMIAFDPVEGVFNYYETESNGIAFFGDSKQYITEGTGSGGDRRCAGCHTGGGLIMKELAAPWLHWPGDFDTPGHSSIIDGNAELLGAESDGIELENQVDEGNDLWNDARVKFLSSGVGTTTTVADLLRPVFCTVEVNLDSEFGDSVFSGPLGGPVTDTRISNFGSVALSNEEYAAIIADHGQRMRVGGKTDTVGVLTRITRGRADSDFGNKLVTGGVLDREFVEDVLLVDFTRAVFSDDRCELLAFAPELTSDELNADAIRQGFIENLSLASPETGTPAADFLRNLQTDEDNASGTVSKFENACESREDKVTVGGEEVGGVAVDYMKYISHVRGLASELPVFEFDGMTMPQDDVNLSRGSRLDPTTCTLTDRYVSVEPALGDDNGGGGGSASCENRCDEEFNEENACQCDEGCLENQDCCDDFDDICDGTGGSGGEAPTLCADRGCDDFVAGASCQCDESCEQFGNCCEDFEEICQGPSNLCEERGCGDFTDGASCQCDDNCTEFDNCCEDFADFCGG